MLTLEQTHAVQEDLNKVCADRPLKTYEEFTPNAFYGNDQIIKQYSKYNGVLKVVVPHGVAPPDDYIWKKEAKTPLPAVLCYTPVMERAYAKASTKFTLLSASPFLYLMELLKFQPKPERRGTIFFPAHSTHYITAEMDFEAIATRLSLLEDEYKPVTVCMYWRDYLLGRAQSFRRKGLRIVSAGHMYDPHFLWRFYHLCSTHRYGASNSLGSQLFYSVKAGCSFFFLEGFPQRLVVDTNMPKIEYSIPAAETVSKLKSLFNQPVPLVTPKQMEIVDYYMGALYLKSPTDLHEQLLMVEKLDKHFIIRDRELGRKLVVPTYYKRKLQKSIMKPLRYVKEILARRAWGSEHSL